MNNGNGIGNGLSFGLRDKEWRIGNDLPLRWRINRQEVPEDFRGRKLKIRVFDPLQRSVPIAYKVEGNLINILFRGMDQITTGWYSLGLSENEGMENSSVIDVQMAFKLVPHSCNSCGKGYVDVLSDFCMPANGLSPYDLAKLNGFEGTEAEWLKSLHGKDGESAYQEWLNQGNQGTEEEFILSLKGKDGNDGDSAYDQWLKEGHTGTFDEFIESLRGPKGDDGIDGNCLYPTYKVDSEMHLKVTSDIETKRIKLDKQGHLTINLR